jgi:hypothetical protein
MTTQEFIAALRKTPDRPLIFETEAGDRVPAGYHLTEIKAAHFDTVDCGGQTNRWDETIVQLWVPEGADDAEGYMTAGKFLRIFDKVTAMIPLNLQAEVRIEYGDQTIFPSLYHVEAVTTEGRATRVVLAPPTTTCKGRDRRLAEVEAGACCETACC